MAALAAQVAHLRCHGPATRAARCHRSRVPVAAVAEVGRWGRRTEAAADAVAVKKAAAAQVVAAECGQENIDDFSDWAKSAAQNWSMNRLRVRCMLAPRLS